MSFETLIATYGYAAIAIGTFFEGETILILGSFAAHEGYLHLPWVIVAAFLGTFIGDQLYFHIGHSRGQAFLDNRPRWQARSARVLDLMARHQTLLILGFRFIYGIRTVTPFLIGSTGRVKALYFLLLDGIGAALWATAIGLLGYVFGATVELLLGDVKRYEYLVLGTLLIVLVSVGIGRWWLRRRKV